MKNKSKWKEKQIIGLKILPHPIKTNYIRVRDCYDRIHFIPNYKGCKIIITVVTMQSSLIIMV